MRKLNKNFVYLANELKNNQFFQLFPYQIIAADSAFEWPCLKIFLTQLKLGELTLPYTETRGGNVKTGMLYTKVIKSYNDFTILPDEM